MIKIFVFFFVFYSVGSINNGSNGTNFAARIETRHITSQWQQYGRFFTWSRPRQSGQFQQSNEHFGGHKYFTNHRRTKSPSIPAKSSVKWLKTSMFDLWRSSEWQTLWSIQVRVVYLIFNQFINEIQLELRFLMCVSFFHLKTNIVVKDAKAFSSEPFEKI